MARPHEKGLVPPVFEGSLDVGFECAGEVSAIGEGVDGLEVGDSVVAFAPACLGSFVTTSASMTSPTATTSRGSMSCLMESSRAGMTPSDL
jgi:NADPH:quinone reductase-like Zn-dependent oxidoreductase